MTTPTDAEIEAMAEQLWEIWCAGTDERKPGEFPWSELVELAAKGRWFKLRVNTFRAMARAALEPKP